MKKNRFIGRCASFFLIAAAISATVLSCKEDSKDLVKPKTVTDVILENDQFSLLRDIMIQAQMSDALRTENLTVFAPDNNAFSRANISATTITNMPKDSAMLFLKNHILQKKTNLSDLKAGEQPTLNRVKVNITKVDSIVSINKSDIVIPNVNADNGVIHVIDSVLVRRYL
ncbi:fasciclin domain-containing protein [Dyadobacter crusticola]|uniref:fasciclin domain-containing protein n=1 Tax=Dyadobacter crusticola TaxID=292407 RepID=UPI0004E210C5|nr:fasciclin domain-containing protein [Dyadobacter crusticola]